MLRTGAMAYRDEVDRVMKENEEIRKALEKARADARVTALRQVLLAFAFGLSWSILGDDASAAEANARCTPPPWGHGWLEVRPDAESKFTIDGSIRGDGDMRFALPPGVHRVRFHGAYGEHCAKVTVYDGRTTRAIDGGQRGGCS